MNRPGISFFLMLIFSTAMIAQRDSVNIAYWVFGEGEPVLLINGVTGMDSRSLESVANQIAQEGFMAIGFDQRGTGSSYLPNPDTHNVTVDLIISDIEHIRQSLQIEEWTILGHAFGGLLAAHYTMKYPSRVKRLVLSNVQSLNLDGSQRIENCIDDFFRQKKESCIKKS